MRASNIDKQYEDKRNTKEWQVFRNKIVERDDYKCQNCGKFGNNAHHRWYQDIVNGVLPDPCDYPAEDLATLCYDCNFKERAQFMKPAIRRLNMALKRKFFCADIKKMAEGLEQTKARSLTHDDAKNLYYFFIDDELRGRVHDYVRHKYPDKQVDLFETNQISPQC